MPMKNNNNNNSSSSKTTVLTIVLVGFMALVLTMAPSVYAAKSSSGGGGGGDSGGGGDGGDSHDSGGGSSSDKSSSDKSSSDGGGGNQGGAGFTGGGSTSGGDTGGDSGSGTIGGGSPSLGGKGIAPLPPGTVDDSFTSKDGKQPTFPIDKDGRPVKHFPPGCGPVDCGPSGVAFCRTHPGACGGDEGHRHHDHDTTVIHKTVVVHDQNNTPQNIIIIQNTQGTCFVTQTQIVSIPNIVQQLLDQCTTVTITQG